MRKCGGNNTIIVVRDWGREGCLGEVQRVIRAVRLVCVIPYKQGNPNANCGFGLVTI